MSAPLAIGERSSHAQASTAAAASAAATIRLSRERKLRSAGAAPACASLRMDDTAFGHVQLGEMGVAVGQVQLDRPFRLRPAPADLGDVIFETLGETDLRTALFTGGGIADRLAPRFHHAGHV